MEAPTDLVGYDPHANADGCWFDATAAQEVIDFFCEHLVHVKGPLAEQPLEPNPWERAFLATLFGWKRADGTRRYREAFVAVPRKNSKTTLCAGIALYMLMCDHESGAEVYCAAADRDQASLLFNIAASNIRRNDMLFGMCKIREAEKRILFRGESLFRAIPADAEGSHGFNASAVIMDELHTQRSRDLYDVLKTSQAARRQPLLMSITTAGHDRDSVCYELWQYAKKVRDGDLPDPAFLPLIYEADEDDDWTDESIWEKCNPNLDRSVSRDYLRELLNRAKQNPAIENTFKNLHLNVWTESSDRWISSEAWNECEGPIPDLAGKPCFVGLDLASTTDLTALVLVFPDGERFYVKPFFFVPEEAIYQPSKQFQSLYRDWRARGLLIETPGAATDYEYVRKRIYELSETYDFKSVGFDQWQAIDTQNQLTQNGMECVKIPQTFGGLWPGVKAFEEAVAKRALVHDGNDVLRWMVASTVVDTDANGNRKPNKRKSHGPQGDEGED
jgi:phage terminase large subunit-like protein